MNVPRLPTETLGPNYVKNLKTVKCYVRNRKKFINKNPLFYSNMKIKILVLEKRERVES